jgi:PDZ domain-containing protein
MRDRLAYAAAPLAALLLSLYAVSLPYFAEGPGPAREVTPLIHVQGHQVFASDGRFILTAVNVLHVNVFQFIGAWLDPTRDLVPESFFIAPGETEQQADQRATSQMDQSKIDASIVVLSKLAGYPEEHRPGVLVEAVGLDCAATGHLFAGDLLRSINGTRITTETQFSRLLRRLPPSDPLRIEGTAGGQPFTVSLSRRPCDGVKRPILGILAVDNFPFPVTISVSDIGGPSAGLMWALGLYDLLTPGDLTGGRTVAGTGEMFPDGTVGPIGGVENKVAAAKGAGAEVFLVPAGENYRDSRAVAGDLTLVPVHTFADALRYLQGRQGSAGK